MKNGFSLVELSIVLVILGLLVGGILAGQSLIRASELRAVSTEYQRFTTAALTFRDKYFYLPGDIPNAESFWGTAAVADASCISTPGTGVLTCNGNGDGRVNNSTRSHEVPRFWEHLNNAGLLEGGYTGIQGGGGTGIGCTSPLGTNCPKSRVSKAGYNISYSSGASSSSTHAHRAGHILFFGNNSLANGAVNDSPVAAVLATEEAWNIDTKMDDGRPAFGDVIVTYKKGYAQAFAADTVDCSTSATATLAEYDLQRTGLSCSLILVMRF